jgi:class 3 adenylate cyclase
MLSKYIPKHFAEIYSDIEKKNFVRVNGTVMFADLSGFTNLSEKLTAKGKEGSEEISRIINEVFEELITIVSRSGGSVYKFGGDAVTVFFPDSVTEKSVLETALLMQAAVRRFTRIDTIAGECSISMKIGIDRGQSAIGRVGNDIKQYFIAGDTLDGACECEHHAEQGEIIVTAGARAEGSGYEFEERNGFFKLLTKSPQCGGKAAGKVAPGTDRKWFSGFIDNELA